MIAITEEFEHVLAMAAALETFRPYVMFDRCWDCDEPEHRWICVVSRHDATALIRVYGDSPEEALAAAKTELEKRVTALLTKSRQVVELYEGVLRQPSLVRGEGTDTKGLRK